MGRIDHVNAAVIDEVENILVGNRDINSEENGNGNDVTVDVEDVSFIDLTEEPVGSLVRMIRQDSLEIAIARSARRLRRNLTRSPILGGMLQHFQNFRRVNQSPSVMNMTVDLTESADETKEIADESLNESNVFNDDSSYNGGGLVIQCPVCLLSLQTLKRRGCSIVSTLCGHLFCSKCLPLSLRNNGRCPTCRKLLGMTGYHQVFI